MNTLWSTILLLTAFAAPHVKFYGNDSAQDRAAGTTRPRRSGEQTTPTPTPAAPSASPRPTPPVAPPAANDRLLNEIRRQDQQDRAAGQFDALPALEHLRRATIFHSNRAFAEARAHWQTVLDRYPTDAVSVPPALFGMGRSMFQEQNYAAALPFFERLAAQFPDDFNGREGRYFIAATKLRLGRFSEAADGYADYVRRYPNGERLEPAYLNVIDTLREANRNGEALNWVAQTRLRFPRTATETNAVFAKLRLELATQKWSDAARTADELRLLSFGKDVMTDAGEISFLRAYALERAGRAQEAIAGYLAVPDRVGSYHGGLATARLQRLAAAQPAVQERTGRVMRETRAAAAAYPVRFSAEVLRAARQQGVDPRLVLAIMKQESGFNPRAKSPAAARGLLQLTIDTARKFSTRAGYPKFTEEDLYSPSVNAAIGCAYIAELMRLFPDTPEAVASSYNGGEDNAARWVRRANNTDAGLFAAEVGFAETKSYVFKVMGNYRAYQTLYTNDLKAR
jgi:soluble lytic murein transglycosylase-like protein